MGAVIGYANVVWFAIKVSFLIPINVIKDGVIIRAKHSKPLSFDLIHRITSRTLIQNSNEYVIDWFINPYLKRYGETAHIPNCPRYNTFEHVNIRLKDDDLALVTKFPGAQFEKGIDVDMKWFVKPNTFDPKKDPVIYYIHGGGFRLRELDTIVLFLGHIHEAYPEATIVLVDYTLTSREKKAVFPQQILESLAGYDWLLKEVGCQNVSIMGDSAGGNLVLSLLQILQKTARPAPKRALAISPWVNPSVHDDSFSRYEIIDYLSATKLHQWGEYYAPNPESVNNPFLNIEYNFDIQAWRNVLDQTELLITYGTEEMFQEQIKRFVDKLSQTNLSRFSIENNVLVDQEGAHTSPLFFTQLNLQYWLSYTMNRKVIRFLTSS